MQPRREAHSGGHTGFVPTRFGTRGRGFKSRRLDQDPEMAFLPSRGLCCCEGFEPQPPKRLEMRRLILGCRFMRADAGKGCPLAEASRSRDARGRSPSCGSEAIEPLIKALTFLMPIEAKIIPSPRPKGHILWYFEGCLQNMALSFCPSCPEQAEKAMLWAVFWVVCRQ